MVPPRSIRKGRQDWLTYDNFIRTRRAEAIGLRYAPGPRVDGFNYNEGGRAITIAVYRSEAQP